LERRDRALNGSNGYGTLGRQRAMTRPANALIVGNVGERQKDDLGAWR
jgi:hypothetical protein